MVGGEESKLFGRGVPLILAASLLPFVIAGCSMDTGEASVKALATLPGEGRILVTRYSQDVDRSFFWTLDAGDDDEILRFGATESITRLSCAQGCRRFVGLNEYVISTRHDDGTVSSDSAECFVVFEYDGSRVLRVCPDDGNVQRTSRTWPIPGAQIDPTGRFVAFYRKAGPEVHQAHPELNPYGSQSTRQLLVFDVVDRGTRAITVRGGERDGSGPLFGWGPNGRVLFLQDGGRAACVQPPCELPAQNTIVRLPLLDRASDYGELICELGHEEFRFQADVVRCGTVADERDHQILTTLPPGAQHRDQIVLSPDGGYLAYAYFEEERGVSTIAVVAVNEEADLDRPVRGVPVLELSGDVELADWDWR